MWAGRPIEVAMTSKLNDRIAEKVVEFLCGSADLGALREWLAPIVWDIEDARDEAAEALAYGIELAISEYDHGHRTIDELRKSLASLVNPAIVGKVVLGA